MRWVLGVCAVLACLQAAPAHAQLPCGFPLQPQCPVPTPEPTVTPAPAVPVRITLRAQPRRAFWFDVARLSGTVSGPPEVREALRDGSLDLELTGHAPGYGRDLQPIPLFPDARGRFRTTDVTGVTTDFQARAVGRFSGASPVVRVRWRPALEVRARPVGRSLRIAFKATGPARIPTEGGDTPVAPGTADRAYFYAGPGRTVPRVGSAPLHARTRFATRELRSSLTVPFSRLPPGGGAAFACFRGTAFRGVQRSFRRCGSRRLPVPSR